MMLNKVLVSVSLALVLLAGWVWLWLWVDERNQRYFIARERIPSWAHGQ